ncbi:hypothetical protein HC928_17495 [bacterium]|nr:hypothetical protein [bacterium]
MMATTVKIEFAKLQDKAGNYGNPYSHIHGYLNVEIGGRSVPHLGYWGPDDVCFNDWIEVLSKIRRAVQKGLPSYKFDEFEQGQPAFLFEVKPGSQIALSIIQSESGEGEDDPEWQQVVFSYADFKAAFLAFKLNFLAEISSIAPEQLAYWTEKFQ